MDPGGGVVPGSPIAHSCKTQKCFASNFHSPSFSKKEMKSRQWQAGVAVVDITPPPGYELAGYAIREQGATGVLDHLYARALALADGATKVLLMTCDLLGMELDDVALLRHKIAARSGVLPNNIFIAASHTHSGPATMRTNGIGERDPAWVSALLEKMARTAERALQTLRPVHIAYATSMIDIGINRRGKIPEGSINPAPDPFGPVDRVLSAFFVRPLHARHPCTVFFSCGCHPTTLGPENRQVSADFPGAAVRFLQRSFGEDTVGLFANGAAGNVNPQKNGSYAAVTELGGQVGAEIVKMTGMTNNELKPYLDTEIREVVLPFKHLPSLSESRELLRRYEDELDNAGTEAQQKIARACLNWAKMLFVKNLKGEIGKEIRIQIQRVTIGEVAIIAIPCEVFVETSLYIKMHSPVPTLVLGYTNGNVGYLPPASAIARGGYEVLEAHKFYGYPDHFAAVAEENVRRAALQLFTDP